MSNLEALREIDKLSTQITKQWHDARQAEDKAVATYLNGKRNGLLIAISILNGEFKAEDWQGTSEGEDY